MKNSLLKLLTITLVSLNIVVTPAYIAYAEEQADTTVEQTQEQTTDTITLTDALEEETTSPSRTSFGTILLAFLIPSILLIICYFIFKVFKF